MSKGFTLIELLIVISILAILSVVVVVVINPAELLRQSRDSTRLSDLSSLNSALALYIADYPTTTWATAITTHCTFGTIAPGTTTPGTCTTNSSTLIDGTGWVNGIFFNQISSGAPLARLPLDPINNSTYYYAFRRWPNFGEYRLYTRMESGKYSTTVMLQGDGGTLSGWFEIGSRMTD